MSQENRETAEGITNIQNINLWEDIEPRDSFLRIRLNDQRMAETFLEEMTVFADAAGATIDSLKGSEEAPEYVVVYAHDAADLYAMADVVDKQCGRDVTMYMMNGTDYQILCDHEQGGHIANDNGYGFGS